MRTFREKSWRKVGFMSQPMIWKESFWIEIQIVLTHILTGNLKNFKDVNNILRSDGFTQIQFYASLNNTFRVASGHDSYYTLHKPGHGFAKIENCYFGFTLFYLNDRKMKTNFSIYSKLLEKDRKIGWLPKKTLVLNVFVASAVEVIVNAKVSTCL